MADRHRDGDRDPRPKLAALHDVTPNRLTSDSGVENQISCRHFWPEQFSVGSQFTYGIDR